MANNIIYPNEYQHLLPQQSQPASETISSIETDYLTPLQLGRLELYELIPFTSVFGMQLKSKMVLSAFANYAADVKSREVDGPSPKMNGTMDDMTNLLNELDAVCITKPLVIAVLVAGMSQLMVGYNIGVLNSSYAVIFVTHTTLQWSVIVASFAIGGTVGAYVGRKVENYEGRRGLIISSFMFLVGNLIQAFARDIAFLAIGRLVVGYASGLSSIRVPIYLGELSPPTLRGTFGSLMHFSLVIGIFLSNLLAFPFTDQESWHVLFALVAVVSTIQLICSTFLSHSPKRVLKDPKSAGARKYMKQLRRLRYGHEVDTEINHLIHALNVQCCDNTDGMLKDMMHDKQMRKLLTCVFFLQVVQQLSGISVIFYYSSMIFEGLSDIPLVETAIVGGLYIIPIYAGLLLLEKLNRRKLMLYSVGGMFISLVGLFSCMGGYLDKKFSMRFVLSYVASYAIGLGPIPSLIVTEMFEAKYVVNAMLTSCQINWVCNVIVAMSFPMMFEKLGPYSFVPFAIVLLITMGFVVVFMPETKGVTPDELRDDIIRSLSSMFALSDDSTDGEYASSVGNIDLEWRRAMDDLRRQEAEDMMRGTYNYGFQPIEQREEEEHHPISSGRLSDWQSSISGRLNA